MKEALLKKRYGIPAALLLVLLFFGTAIAFSGFATISSDTNVEEPLSPADEVEFSDIMYPGETNTWSFDIVNSAPVDYLIIANLTFSGPVDTTISLSDFPVTIQFGFTITDFTVDGVDETDDLLDDGSAKFSIPAEGTITCSLEIKTKKNMTPGPVSVTLHLSRE